MNYAREVYLKERVFERESRILCVDLIYGFLYLASTLKHFIFIKTC